MAERKTLRKRYEIPLDHLDFKYVKECNDAREMERIVHILQSGEEGYFPDLTKCAEDKLRELKPNSRLFRCEEQLRRKEDVNASEVQPIYEFSKKVRDRDQRLAALKTNDENLQPIRQAGFIKLNAKDKKDEKINKTPTGETNSSKTVQRIKSTDYRKWDEYDPDAEILRMDLEEERVQEEVERKNRLNNSKSKTTPLITEIKEEEDRIRKLTDIERDNLAEEHRLRGNEYFRAKEYKEALNEYTRAISINPEKDAAAYNNRAMTNIKLKNYEAAMRDCEKCLSIEPQNLKAMYRLAESSMNCGYKENALEMFTKVLDIDPNNVNAKNSIEYLRLQIGEKPPANATRLMIKEEPRAETKQLKDTSKASKSFNKTMINNKKEAVSSKDYDLAAAVRPKEIIPNKVIDTATNLFNKNKSLDAAENSNKEKMEIQTKEKQFELENDEKIKIQFPIMEQNCNIKRNKPLIEEI